MMMHGLNVRKSVSHSAPPSRFWSPERLPTPVPLDFVHAADPFARTAIHCKAAGACEIVVLDCGPGALRGLPDVDGQLCVILSHRGSVEVDNDDAGGPGFTLSEGDFFLYDSAAPMDMRLEAPAQLILLCVPRQVSCERMPWLRRIAGAYMYGRQGPGALFSGFIRNMWQGLQRYDGAWSDTLDDVLWPMIEMVFSAEREAVSDASRRESRRRALLAYIEDNLCEPDLDTQTIAAAAGMSPRYVQILFSELDITPSAFIRNRRLELAARRLAQNGVSASITEVAFEVGFNDLSSFCRAFRQRYRVAPRDYRAGRRQAA